MYIYMCIYIYIYTYICCLTLKAAHATLFKAARATLSIIQLTPSLHKACHLKAQHVLPKLVTQRT